MPPKSSLRRGGVVLVLFPHSNLRAAKRRPALVVQADGLGTGLPQVVIAMITSNLARAGHPSRVAIRISSQQGRRAGRLSDSVVMTDNLATVGESEIDRVIGAMRMAAVDVALRHSLGL